MNEHVMLNTSVQLVVLVIRIMFTFLSLSLSLSLMLLPHRYRQLESNVFVFTIVRLFSCMCVCSSLSFSICFSVRSRWFCGFNCGLISSYFGQNVTFSYCCLLMTVVRNLEKRSNPTPSIWPPLRFSLCQQTKPISTQRTRLASTRFKEKQKN